MSKQLDKAKEQIAAGQYKKAVSSLWEAETSARVDPGEAGELLEAASAIRDRTDGRIRAECETLIGDAKRFIEAARSEPVSAGSAGVAAPPGLAQATVEARSDVAGAVITICGGLLAILSAFLPWIAVHAFVLTINRNAFQLGADMGFSADGLVLLLLGLVAVLIGITRAARASMPAFVQRSPIILGIALAILPANRVGSINDVAQRVSATSSLASASIGFGLWLAFFAAAITLIGGLVLRSKATAVSEVAATGVTATPPDSSAAETAAPDTATRGVPAPEGPRSGAPALDVEERLRRLNDLRDKNLVTPQEYETKRAALLSEL